MSFKYQNQDHDHWGMYLEKALSFAVEYHSGQTDFHTKAPYILHLLRVAHSCSSYEEKIVALLHDIVEDTPCSQRHIEINFPTEIAEAVDFLTRGDELYVDYCRNIQYSAAKGRKSAEIALAVKLADIADNIHLHRDALALTDEWSMENIERWRNGWRILNGLD